jgi:hypothetical protein
MRREELESKSKKELVDKLEEFYRSPLLPIYFSIKGQLEILAEQVEEADIDFGNEESKMFKNFILWSEKSLIIGQNIEGLASMIDKETLVEETKKRLAAREGSVESMRKLGRDE